MGGVTRRIALFAFCVSAFALSACGGGTPPLSEPISEPTSEPTRLALPNQAEAEPGVITGGPPSRADLRAAADAGVVMVISLRTEAEGGLAEERAQTEALGMRFAHLPVAGAEGVTADVAREVDALLAEADGPVILHCGSGNRAGAIMALRAFLNGETPDAAIALGRAAGLRGLEDTARALIDALCADDTERAC
ncbi:MAG: hypothetical protein SangKO_022890 [Sandaracinaceae bacterium]